MVGAVALLAGGVPERAVALGVSMTSLQFAIGALNDVVDAQADRGRIPPKPIPAGLVAPRTALLVVAAGTGVGIGIAAALGPGVVLLALTVLVIGAAYDLLAKGTPWSWLPFAIGIPLLPVYGWYGATGTLPAAFAALVPMAVLGGAALAIANARADLGTDLASGTRSVASGLGDGRAWVLHAVLWAVTAAIAIGWLLVAGVSPLRTLPVGLVTIVIGIAVVRSRGVSGRERRWAWESEALAGAVAAVVWLWAALG